MADNLNKRPRKGILKNSSSFDTQEVSSAKKCKETKWDEMNIIATLHPADKDYGHMKIEEPKTPYNYVNPDSMDVLDAAELAEKIKLGADQLPKAMREDSEGDDDDDDEEEEQLSPEEMQKRKEFESKRKMHYNEFYAVKLARKLLEEEDEDDDDNDKKKGDDDASDDVNMEKT